MQWGSQNRKSVQQQYAVQLRVLGKGAAAPTAPPPWLRHCCYGSNHSPILSNSADDHFMTALMSTENIKNSSE